MDEYFSRTNLLVMQTIGLSITGLLLLVIASCLQLMLLLFSGGALQPQLGVLAFSFLFYVCSLFLAVGTQARPAHAPYWAAKVALHAGFLTAAFLLFARALPSVWLGLSIAACALLAAGRWLFAYLRARGLHALRAGEGAAPALLLERAFFVRSRLYYALPLGALAGTLLGALRSSAASQVAWHTLAGMLAAVAVAELLALASGARGLARELVQESQGERTSVGVVSASDRERVLLLAPVASASNVDAGVEAASAASTARQLLVLGQLERTMMVAAGALSAWHVLRGAPSFAELVGVPLALSALGALLPWWVGQRASRARVLAPLHGAASTAAQAQLRRAMLPRSPVWLALLACVSLTLLLHACLAPLLAAAHG